MKGEMKEYIEQLQYLATLKHKHPDADLTWPYFPDGTPKPPTPAQERREATHRKKHLDCEKRVCRRHRRCAYVAHSCFEHEAPTGNGHCEVFGTGPDVAAQWANLQFSRIVDLM